jgi:hypothetical protein
MPLAPGPGRAGHCRDVKLGLLLATCLMLPGNAALPDALSDCLDARVAEHEAEVPFSHTGRVECPPTELVGLIPRERRHDRSAVVSYVPPEGFAVLVDPSRGTPSIESVGAAGGSVGAHEIDEAGVSVTIECRGLPLREGRAWQEVRITGFVYRPAGEDLRREWLLACARELGNAP